ncbi:carbon storage regulator [Legionella septentrionalis]|uniref:carbon storage regulator n=1 Tax=Legionella septentrionalis TaxID=2498109 RepID=UPI000F8D6E70|nr:carbon storage regulator [Legionella septentrionalis]RUQ96644.1 carbon storage regulator [Legionella septentrionalis]
MLVLKRKVGETIVINKTIYITVLKDLNGKIDLGIEAPKDDIIDRYEIFQRKLKNSKEISVPTNFEKSSENYLKRTYNGI